MKREDMLWNPRTTTTPTASPSECTLLTTIQRAFWDAFQDRLRQHDTRQLRAMLHELLHAVHALTPNRTDLHNRLERAVDIDLLVQMVAHQSMDTMHFGRATCAVVDHLKPLLAQARVEAFDTWFTNGKPGVRMTRHNRLNSIYQPFERMHKEIGIAQRGCDRVRQRCGQHQHQHRHHIAASAPPDTTYPKSQSKHPVTKYNTISNNCSVQVDTPPPSFANGADVLDTVFTFTAAVNRSIRVPR